MADKWVARRAAELDEMKAETRVVEKEEWTAV